MAEKILNTRFQLRHDIAENWLSANPVLKLGEVGIETDTKKMKVGDGVTEWESLEYFIDNAASQTAVEEAIADAKAEILGEVSDGFNTLEKIESVVTENADAISDNADAITAIQSDLDTANTGIKARLTAAEADIDTLEGKIAGVFHFKGVATKDGDDLYVDDEKIEDAEIGDVYSVDDEEWAWNGEEWFFLGITTDLSAYYNKSQIDALLANDGSFGSRVVALEAASHTHANATELALIQSGDVAKWNAYQTNVIESIKVAGASSPLAISNKEVTLPLATSAVAGLVLSSTGNNKIAVLSDGTMEVNALDVQKLYVADNDTFVLNGGTAE